MRVAPGPFGWWSVIRLGFVQAALGAIVVLMTSTLNRVMVVELALPALLPGLLVGLHYAVQITRPRMGHGGDVGGRRTPWILGGVAVLALGAVLAALATTWMAARPGPGLLLAVAGFLFIGLGISAAGTSLLALLARRVEPDRRAGAATVVWLMMIVGFAVTAGVAGQLLDPYTPARLVAVTLGVSLAAVAVTAVSLWRLEGHPAPASHATGRVASPGFRVALAEVWADLDARRFAIFVFVSMLAYSAQDLILEPFAGSVLGYTPGESTQLSGLQHGGVLVGMLLAAFAGRVWRGRRLGSLRAWTIGGCLASALAMAGLAVAGLVGPSWPFAPNVVLLGVSNGAFSIAAIASMMQLAGAGAQADGQAREGVRMGLWGAAQGVAFGLGGLLGAGASDLARGLLQNVGTAYAAVFAFEAAMFVFAASVVVGRTPYAPSRRLPKAAGLAAPARPEPQP
jgi:BCD family chlorophyll transporter-like MFS transporter